MILQGWSPSTIPTPPVAVSVFDLQKEKYRFRISQEDKKPKIMQYQVRLPAGLTCERCVMQWTWTTGNTWGYCPDGTGQVGCGPQVGVSCTFKSLVIYIYMFVVGLH